MLRIPRQQYFPFRYISAFRVALIYALFSALWILFSDQLLLLLVVDPRVMTRIQMAKGWIFVLATSLLIYGLLLREISRVIQAERALSGKERDYREVFNATNEGIVIHDAETCRIVDANLTFQKMCGYTLQEIQQRPMNDLNSNQEPFTQAEAERRIRQAVQEGPQMFEWLCRRCNGELYWVEVTLRVAHIGNGKRVIAVLRDIDDRKKAEAQSAELEQRLQQARKMEAIGALAGGVAHDFNNILSAVLGYADLALEELPGEGRAAHYLREVVRAGHRARDLVKQILTFSRRNQPEQVPLLVQSVIEEAMKLLRASIPTTIDIAVKIDDRCGPLLADPTQIHQVVMNLCTNAYHAMRENGGTLTVALDEVQLGGGSVDGVVDGMKAGVYLRLLVADTGVGIPEENIKKIFDPYYTTKAMGEGTGMGLSVVHGIVSSLGGAIGVRSPEGGGTAFEIYLPVSPLEMIGEVKTHPSEYVGTGRILLVDDEEPLIDLGKQMLERSGYSVVAVTDSNRALELFSGTDEGFDLIVTDMNMPHLDGLSLIRRCREHNPEIPAILCTGYSDQVDRERALAEGVNDFLMKPIARQELAECVDRVLGRNVGRI